VVRDAERAFWDDALAGQGFAELVCEDASQPQGEDVRRFAKLLARAHRDIFAVEEVDTRAARLVDAWSGTELLVTHLDEAQRIALELAEGLMDARVVAPDIGPRLFVSPGAFHHPAEAFDPAMDVLGAARERNLDTGAVLDALLRMELVFRTSSRVKIAFAYRAAALK